MKESYDDNNDGDDDMLMIVRTVSDMSMQKYQ